MKRFFNFAIAALMAFSFSQNARAYDFGFDWGVRGGVNHTNLDFEYEDEFDDYHRIQPGTGFFVGPSLRINLPPCFGVDASVFYDQKRVFIDSELIKFHNVSIPLNVRLNIPFNKDFGIYVAAGPQFAFNVGDSDYSWGGEVTASEDRFKWKKSSFSINLGGGLILTKHLELGFVYNIPLGNTGEADITKTFNAVTSKETYSSKTNSWAITAFVHF